MQQWDGENRKESKGRAKLTYNAAAEEGWCWISERINFYIITVLYKSTVVHNERKSYDDIKSRAR